MKCKVMINFFLVPILLFFLFAGCKDDKAEPQGTLKIGLTDTRSSTQKAGNDIIDALKLNKFEVTISKIELKTESGGTVVVLEDETVVDLRNFQGSVKDLGTLNIPLGKYKGINMYFSGIELSYDGNTYNSSVGGIPSLTLADLPGITFSTEQGVPNTFPAELKVDLSFDFELTEDLSNKTIRIGLDAVASCYEIEFNCPVCTNQVQYFVGLRPSFQMNIIFEEGIQQIKHSPPLGIELISGTTVSYYGIHTFVDFNGIGGTINSHTSQHVYRGDDGLLLIDAEDMATNTTALSPNTINAVGQTDVSANEVFNFSAIEATLSGKGYSLVSGNTYYFSLRKTWNITSGNTNYEITRICEPIPVLWP